ncbi:MAG TPA: DUF2961 domain-containing protein [Acidobacteriaceae bacterium]|nr:DUF2961 domain-containing protein [Acidobacteriaceae bacterium]
MAKIDRRSLALSLAALPLVTAALVPAGAAAPSAKKGRVLRGASTFSHVGKEEQPFVDHVEATIAEQNGQGFLDHMWFGGSFPGYDKLRLRIYVDREAVASIDAELGLAAGVGFADPAAPWGTVWTGVTGAPSGIYLNYRVPFSKHVKVTVELPKGVASDTVFWWIVRGLQNVPLQIADFLLPENARLRLYKREDLVVEPLDEFDLCKMAGEGMVFQVTIAAGSANFQYMEGQMRAYMGADVEPQMLSSGLEDYFLGTYYFNRNLYHLPQAGLTHKDQASHSFSAYRFHDIDPLVFSDGIRLACRCGEKRGEKVFGPTGDPKATTYTTYVWAYEWQPVADRYRANA